MSRFDSVLRGPGVAHPFPDSLSCQLWGAEIGAPTVLVSSQEPEGSECPLRVSTMGHVASAWFPLCADPGAGQWGDPS